MTATRSHDIQRIRADFDQIATFGDESGADRYNAFLLSLVPASAADVLEVGCGLGRLASAIAGDRRSVVGLDLSPAMIQRAMRESPSPRVSYLCADFSEHQFGDARFDCIMSAAALHHMPLAPTIQRMQELLRPGGRLIIHDMRRDEGLADALRAYLTLCHHSLIRLLQTGRPFPPPHVRAAWLRHGKDEHYLSWREVLSTNAALLPGARAFYHWMWRYTITWDKPN